VQETGFTEMPISLNLDDLGSVRLLLLWLTLISTLLLLPLVIIRYKLKIQWLQSKNLLSINDTLYSTGDVYHLLLELFLYILIPTPFYSGQAFQSYNEPAKVQTAYSYNELFCLLVLLRVFMVFRMLLGNCRYYTNSAHRICQLTGCKNGYLFVVKCLMKSNPLQVLITALCLSIITFAYAVKVCERPLIFALTQKELALNPTNPTFPIPNDVSDYYNSVWLMMVTMTTVGYGDYYPRTTPGRAITFFACIFGVIVVSLMTIILMNFTDMNNSESRSYNIIEKLGIEKEKRKHAAFVITNLTKLGFWKGLLMKTTTKFVTEKMEKIKLHLKIFGRLSSQRGNLDKSKNLEEEISRHFTFLREDHKHLEEKINDLCERNLVLLDRLGYLQEENANENIEENKIEGEENIDNNPNSATLISSSEKIIYTPWLKRQKYKAANIELAMKKNEEIKETL